MLKWHPPSGQFKPNDVKKMNAMLDSLWNDYVYQVERGKKKLHYQIFFKLKTKIRPKQLISKLNDFFLFKDKVFLSFLRNETSKKCFFEPFIFTKKNKTSKETQLCFFVFGKQLEKE